jgi:hypothetical protein
MPTKSLFSLDDHCLSWQSPRRLTTKASGLRAAKHGDATLQGHTNYALVASFSKLVALINEREWNVSQRGRYRGAFCAPNSLKASPNSSLSFTAMSGHIIRKY